MNIKNFFKKKEQEKEIYVTSFRRSFAASIDMWLVLFLRVLVMQTLGSLWFNAAIINFMAEFNEHFGTETIKNTREHIDFIIHNRIFFYSLLFYAIVIFVGALYHSYLNSSVWRGTIGKRVMKIIMEKEDGEKISFSTGLWHYFLSILPFAFIIYLVSYQVRNKLSFFQAVTSSEFNVFLGIAFLMWTQIHLFTKRKTTAYDLICKTIFINGRTAAKWPWSQKN